MTLSTTSRVALTVALIVTVEAILLLHVLGLGYEPLRLFDYQMFHRLAVNILDHRSFSQETAPPYPVSYFRGPGYPFFIALVYAIFGRHVFAVRSVQFLLLAITAWLLFVVTRRFFSDRVAGIASVIGATYPPLVFVSAEYTAETLSTFGVVLIALQMSNFQLSAERKRLGSAVMLGVSAGALALIRPGFTLLVFFIAGVVAWAGPSRTPKQRMSVVAAVLAGYSVVVAPWIVRNGIVSGRPLAGPSSISGWNLYVSAQQWSGEITYGLLQSDWRLILREYNLRFDAARRAVPVGTAANRGVSVAAARESYMDRVYTLDARKKLSEIPLRRYASRLIPRLYWLWSTSDLSPWRTGNLHRVIQCWHVVVFALTLAGFYICRHALIRHVIFWIVALYLTLLHLVYQVEARYTLPGRPLILVYAAVAMERLARVVAVRRETVDEASSLIST